MSRKSFAALAALALLLSVLVATPASAVPRSERPQFEPLDATLTIDNPFKNETAGFWIVRLEDDAVATYTGGVAQFTPTSPRATGKAKLDARSPAAQAYGGYLEGRQQDLLTRMESAFSRSLEPRFMYTNALNGFSIWLTPDEAAQVAKMPGVAFVEKSKLKQLTTDAGPEWIGAPTIWEGTATGVSTRGEGVIAGIIDSGINWINPSFADVGADGYDHTNPFGAGNYVGVCDPAEPTYDDTFVCNDKLIGAWNFFASDDMTAIDHDGHGSHTASTTAGNVTDASIVAPTLTVNRMISGVAPHANIISYRVCGDDELGQGSCEGDAIVAAIEQAIIDGVDVINYSIGSNTPTNPYTQSDDLAFLAARTAGIFVAHSAGNNGPDPATSGSPNAPWMTHVAAMTHDRSYPNGLIDLTGGDTAAPADIEGLGFTSGYGPAEIVYAGNYPSALTDSPELCGVGALGDFVSPWPAGTFNGEIVVCRRGTFGRVEKGANVLASGAGGYVLVDNGGGLSGDPHELPGVHIPMAEGDVLIDWLNSGTGHMGTIAGATLDIDPANGDVLAGFSSRGPNPETNWLMPSIAAPGVDIIAAHGKYNAEVWTFLSGTSMSSPHIAGSAALMTALYPDWSPAEIQSALQLTAKPDVLDQNRDPATPFDVGSGRVQLELAAQTGIVMDETEDDYLASDPALGGDPTQLNLASIYNDQCVLECSFTRTVTSVLDGPMTWDVTGTTNGIAVSVTPSNFTLDAGASQDLTITVDVSAAEADTFHFGSVVLTPGDGSVPVAHMPVAVQPTTGDLPDSVHITTRRDAGSWPVNGLTALEITEFTATYNGLVKATLTEGSLLEDSNNGSAYDDPTDGVLLTLVDVGPGATHLIAEVTQSEAPDLDMFVGFDANNDGIAQESEEECVSASGTALESCMIENPAEGTWWVLIQNWGGSSDQPDAFTLATAVLDGTDAGNMTVEGPATQPQLEPFDVRVFFDLDGAMPGDRYYGSFSLGTDSANPGNLGTVPVVLDRLADDVTKTASVEEASPFDTFTYEIVIQPNSTPEDLAYTIVDTIPDGLTYVPGSASASEGTVSVSGNTVTYEGTSLSPALAEQFYTMTTSTTDASCDTPFGGYVNLADFGINPIATLVGDTMVWTSNAGGPFNFFGIDYPSFSFTDDGFAIFDPATNYGGEPWVPQVIPDPALPNNVAAAIWQDFEIFYDATTGAGISLASAAGGALVLAEYDNVQPWGGGPDLLDFEIMMWREPGPGPELFFAYDNVAYTFPATVGVENAAGTDGVALLQNESTSGVIDDGVVVCFDWTGPSFDPIVITYDVKVDLDAAEGTVTNEAVHVTDNPGATDEVASADVEIVNPSPKDLKGIALAILEGIDTAGLNGPDQLRIAEAIESLHSSLNPNYWVDEFILDPTSGRAVFHHEGTAATRLMRVRPNSAAYADVQTALQAMTLADMKLARTMIELAKGTDAQAFFIARAEAFMADAEHAMSIGRPDRAVRYFGIAWHLANALVNRPGRVR